MACDQATFLNPSATAPVPYVTRRLASAPGPVVAVSDFMRAVPDQNPALVPQEFASLGTDGFGFADTRAAARRFLLDRRPVRSRPGSCSNSPSAVRSTTTPRSGHRALPSPGRHRRHLRHPWGRCLRLPTQTPEFRLGPARFVTLKAGTPCRASGGTESEVVHGCTSCRSRWDPGRDLRRAA